ncbi:GNAT family N-acetyltransferase [Paenibacillus doosanensis]|uniref:N-acetyltransferase domain-containing protein n=1 Tax=Paenibacillus konkukensis TaxID=2020716 RepID=A0ABY4RQI4_9BACL|nr:MULTISPECIES: GNAT family N-acetyltransferase [Paenibacillus]MCS7461777.1 GNAT family N-acetyltransferase [Paenibacillus doosanensis]UQZ83617.1 hypothetical protein SK3146_02804 [Paenibacillus konkukensis]
MKTYEIRNIPREQFADSLALSEFAFQYEIPPEERENRMALLKERECWGAFVGGKLAARMTIHGLHTWILGRRMAMGGVASVATWPEYRRGGMVASLLGNALKVMREEGQAVSFLHPFQFAFYRKYGWETYTETKKYEIPTELLPKLPPQPGRVERTAWDEALIAPLYTAYARRYNGTLDRDASWWKNRIVANKKGVFAVYYDSEGEPSGYVHYMVRERHCRIHELVYLHQEAWKGLWKFIADHDSMIDKVTWSAPADDRLTFQLDNPRVKQEIQPYFMARIVDVKQFVKQYPFAPIGGDGARMRLQISDAQAGWNDGEFLLQVSADGQAEAVKLPAGESAAGLPAASCGIGTLAAMLTGYQRPSYLREIGRLDGDEEAAFLLERLIPVRSTYLPDFF